MPRPHYVMAMAFVAMMVATVSATEIIADHVKQEVNMTKQALNDTKTIVQTNALNAERIKARAVPKIADIAVALGKPDPRCPGQPSSKRRSLAQVIERPGNCTSCCYCPPGYYYDGNNYAQCGVDAYCPGGWFAYGDLKASAAPDPCPAGLTTAGVTGASSESACVCPVSGQTVCSGNVCKNLQTDTSNCGTCGNVCSAGLVCTIGQCVCPTGQNLCGNTCKNLQTDVNNCGTCGNICGAGFTCSAGQCVCPAGENLCGSTCKNLQTDNNNCGTCGNVCGTGSSCAAGQCVCPAGQNLCGNACTDLQTDANNCGACGNACASGIACVNGACNAAPCPPVVNVAWTTSTTGLVAGPGGWIVSPDGNTIRYDVQTSQDCGGTNGNVQTGTAVATVNVGNCGAGYSMSVVMTGMGEAQDPGFEEMNLSLNNVAIIQANSAGGGINCAVAPVTQTVLVPGPYTLAPGSSNTFDLTFSTNDPLQNSPGTYYSLALTFTPI